MRNSFSFKENELRDPKQLDANGEEGGKTVREGLERGVSLRGATNGGV